MKYRAILFDADGLIIHSPRFSERLQKEYGITWETLKPFFQGPFQECKVGKADLKNELAKTMGAWGWKDSVDALLAFWFQGDVVDEEIKNLVSGLKQDGVRCYLATNQEEYREKYLENELGLNNIFDEFFVSARLGYLKNDPKFFEDAIKNLGLEKQEILFVDHDEENIDAAKTAGLSTYALKDIEAFKSFLKTQSLCQTHASSATELQ